MDAHSNARTNQFCLIIYGQFNLLDHKSDAFIGEQFIDWGHPILLTIIFWRV